MYLLTLLPSYTYTLPYTVVQMKLIYNLFLFYPPLSNLDALQQMHHRKL